MTNTAALGKYMYQNGKRIPLEKERDCITSYIFDGENLELIKRIDGILDIKHVFNEIYRLKVDESKLEFIMHSIRNGFGLVCHHAYKPLDATNTRYYITDKITVKFKSGICVDDIDNLMEKWGLRYVRRYGDATYLMQVTESSGMNPVKVANAMADDECVEYAEPNLVNRFTPSYVPNDVKFREQWHLKSEEGPELVDDADVSVTEAWDITIGSRDIVIAILDDGFDLSHPDFQPARPDDRKVVFPKDFVDGDNNPLPGKYDFHGTPCAGVAIAEANEEGVVGAAPGCSFMPVRIPFGADPNLLHEIFEYVGQHAHIISCSWGPPPVYAPLHQLLYDQFTRLAQTGGPDGKGCTIVFAAHNFNAPLKDLNNSKGVEYLSGTRVYKHKDKILNGNATHPSVICVSASTSLNKKAAYSNWGKEVTVCAPSNNWHPLRPHEKLKGRGVCTTDNFKVGSYFSPNDRYTTQFGGTSSAAPLVAGIAGLIKSANPLLTASEVKQVLIETTDKITDTALDIVLGHNKGTYDANGHSEWFGHGKVNALKAVRRAVSLLQQPDDGHDDVVVDDEPQGHVDEPHVSQAPNADPTKTQGLRFSIAKTGNLRGVNDQRTFKLNIGKKLVVEVHTPNTNNDFDIYIKRGSMPTKESYDQRAISQAANERVVFGSLLPGDYYIMVTSFRGDGNFELKASLE